MKARAFLILITAATILLWRCGGDTQTQVPTDSSSTEEGIVTRKISGFSADNAYQNIEKQLAFGFRIPGTAAHKKCADWLFKELQNTCDTAYFQTGEGKAPKDGKKIPIYNIIGSVNPKAKNRMIIASHWDSRPYADQDDQKQTEPILGANDGASGVGIILELAKNLKTQKPDWGIDFILFDAEDLGISEIENSFCLGSQYWGKNPHIPNYKASFGVLLDMVGGNNAQFMWEENSNNYANWVLVHTWQIAQELGYENYFPLKLIGAITDDHKYVYEATKIPMIDIIQYNPNSGFAPFWHTHDDNMDAVDKRTLNAVGNTMLHLIFNPPASL